MAEIRVEHLRKQFSDFVAVQDSNLHRRERRVLRHARPLRLRQDDDAPDDRRARAADLREHPARRRRCHLQARRRARHRLRLPALRALSAHERAQEHRLPAQEPGHAARRDQSSASRRRRGCCASTTSSNRPVSGLAGGDRQRVALGRAIVRRPKVFLMDEPLGTLDTEFRDLMVRELRELHNRIGATTVYVTHDQLEAMAMADKIAVMNRGVIEQFATPQEIYDRPVSMFVADFIGSPPMNFLPLHARRVEGREEPPRQRRDGRRAGDPRRPGRDGARARHPPRAHPLRRFVGASRLGLRRRISRHDADRDGHDRARAAQGAASRERPRGERRDGRASPSAASGCRSSRRRAAARFASALDDKGGAHG